MGLETHNITMTKDFRPEQAKPLDVQPSHVPEDPLAHSIDEALRHGRASDAVRCFLKAIENQDFPNHHIRAAMCQLFGDTLTQHLILACASFPCPFCNGGFAPCGRCNGNGKMEGALACSACQSLGAAPCDFCSGSGLAGYNFFPTELHPDVAVARVTHSMRLISTFEKHESSCTPLNPTRREFLQAYSELARSHAIFNNVVHLLRGGINLPRTECARLVARCWRGLAEVESGMSQILLRFARRTRMHVQVNGDDQLFEEDRRCLLEAEAARLGASAHDRLAHMQHHSHRGI